MNIFLIKVNCKLNLENSFDIYFLIIEHDVKDEIDRTCLAVHSLQRGH